MTDEPSETGPKIERDHPQTRKAESDARGSAMWSEDVVEPDEERTEDEGAEPSGAARRQSDETRHDRDFEARKISEMAEEGRTGGEAPGSSAGGKIGSGAEPARGELGGGVPMAEEGTSSPAGARSPGGESRE